MHQTDCCKWWNMYIYFFSVNWHSTYTCVVMTPCVRFNVFKAEAATWLAQCVLESRATCFISAILLPVVMHLFFCLSPGFAYWSYISDLIQSNPLKRLAMELYYKYPLMRSMHLSVFYTYIVSKLHCVLLYVWPSMLWHCWLGGRRASGL